MFIKCLWRDLIPHLKTAEGKFAKQVKNNGNNGKHIWQEKGDKPTLRFKENHSYSTDEALLESQNDYSIKHLFRV